MPDKLNFFGESDDPLGYTSYYMSDVNKASSKKLSRTVSRGPLYFTLDRNLAMVIFIV